MLWGGNHQAGEGVTKGIWVPKFLDRLTNAQPVHLEFGTGPQTEAKVN